MMIRAVFSSFMLGMMLTGCADQSASDAGNASDSTTSEKISLFDGKTFAGWEGDTAKIWRIEDGAIVGGSLTETVRENDFLCTTGSYDHFRIKLKFKLTGSEGFVNSGMQFRSKRLTNPANEMTGYQADLGNGYWGSLYDESRRNKTIAIIDSARARSVVKQNEWNDYEVVAQGSHIQIFLNGEKTVDYTEEDASIPQDGLIGFQIHGGGKAEAWFKDIYLEKLSAGPAK